MFTTKDRWERTLLGCLLLLVFLELPASADYLLLDPPPDADKPGLPNPPGNDLRCWQATAANMLAGAGYGDGATLQARADDIFGDLTAQYGLGSGWVDTGLSWWLGSGNNSQAGANPYTVVSVYGNKTKIPWANANGARFIGNELRKPHFTGISISWPSPTGGTGGHAITGWGDSGGEATLATNPARLKVTDSDRDPAGAGDVHTYAYDAYNNPNPGLSNQGNGWYFNYSNNHPFIKHIVTLSPTDNVTDHTKTQKVVGSYRIHQNNRFQNATDLHYGVGTDVDILSYRTTIDWDTANSPSIVENYQGDERRSLNVDWDLTDNPVPFSNDVTITTEFVVPTWNAIQYSDVYFTYPDALGFRLPEFNWNITTPFLDVIPEPNVSGGYVVGAFDLVDPSDPNAFARYRFQHEYDFDQDPEFHNLLLEAAGQTSSFAIDNLQLGHSYGILDNDELWSFTDWISQDPEMHVVSRGNSFQADLDWSGLLPYPEGEVFTVYDPIPNVPEPGSLMLLAIALTVIGRIRCPSK